MIKSQAAARRQLSQKSYVGLPARGIKHFTWVQYKSNISLHQPFVSFRAAAPMASEKREKEIHKLSKGDPMPIRATPPH